MKLFILVGLLLQVFFVISYSESISHLERRDLTSLEQNSKSELFKRRTSPPNPISCKAAIEGNPDLYSDLRDVNKAVTYAVKHQLPCVIFQTVIFVVFTLDGQPAAFQYTTAKDVKSLVADFIQKGCIIERPKTLNPDKIPSNSDDGKAFGVGWLNPPVVGDQVTTCSQEVMEGLIANILGESVPCDGCN